MQVQPAAPAEVLDGGPQRHRPQPDRDLVGRPRLLGGTRAVVGRQQRLGQPPARPRLLVDVPEPERLDGGPPQVDGAARRAAAPPRPPPARARPAPSTPISPTQLVERGHRRPGQLERAARPAPAGAPPPPCRRRPARPPPRRRARRAPWPPAAGRRGGRPPTASRADGTSSVASSTAVSASPDQAARSTSAAAVTIDEQHVRVQPREQPARPGQPLARRRGRRGRPAPAAPRRARARPSPAPGPARRPRPGSRPSRPAGRAR